jgi:hypothetical protein
LGKYRAYSRNVGTAQHRRGITSLSAEALLAMITAAAKAAAAASDLEASQESKSDSLKRFHALEVPDAHQGQKRLQGQKNGPGDDMILPAVFLRCRTGSAWPAACGTGDPGVAPGDGRWARLAARLRRTCGRGASRWRCPVAATLERRTQAMFASKRQRQRGRGRTRLCCCVERSFRRERRTSPSPRPRAPGGGTTPEGAVSDADRVSRCEKN